MDRDHASLFRRFADLEPEDPDAILSFARQYGWLGSHPALTRRAGSLTDRVTMRRASLIALGE